MDRLLASVLAHPHCFKPLQNKTFGFIRTRVKDPPKVAEGRHTLDYFIYIILIIKLFLLMSIFLSLFLEAWVL